MFLLDTNVISELRKAKTGRANAAVICWAASVPSRSMFISAITVMELEMGTLLLERRDAAQGAMLRSWLNGQVLPRIRGAFCRSMCKLPSGVARSMFQIAAPIETL